MKTPAIRLRNVFDGDGKRAPMTCMQEDRVGAMWDVTATEQAMSGFVMFTANLTT